LRERATSERIDVQIPLGIFTCVTGVFGFGKSTLIHDVLFESVARSQSANQDAGSCKAVMRRPNRRSDHGVIASRANPAVDPDPFSGVMQGGELFASLP